ncbi:hypothetical protein D3C73_1260410 [compost metagenome]
MCGNKHPSSFRNFRDSGFDLFVELVQLSDILRRILLIFLSISGIIRGERIANRFRCGDPMLHIKPNMRIILRTTRICS